MVPLDKGDRVRIIEIIGVYRRIVADEFAAAKGKPNEEQLKEASRQKFGATLDEMNQITDLDDIQECYRAYCDCLKNNGANCRQELQRCIDKNTAAWPEPEAVNAPNKDRSI
jgi:transposase